MALVVKNLPASAGDLRDTSLLPGSGRSPGRGHSNPFQCSWLQNPVSQRVRHDWSNLACLHALLLLFSCSLVSDSAVPWIAAHQASLSSLRVCSTSRPLSWWCYPPSLPLSSSSPPAFSLSRHPGLFQWVALHIRFPKYWNFSFSMSPSSEYLGLISFQIYWFDLLAVQGTLKSLLQYHSLKASVLWHSAFFVVQLSPPYMTTGKTTALTRWTFVGKVMSLLFDMLSRFVIAFFPSSKCLLISWLESLFTVILEPKKIKFVTVSIFFLICFPWSDGNRCHDIHFLNTEFKPGFHSPFSPSSRDAFVPPCFLS